MPARHTASPIASTRALPWRLLSDGTVVATAKFTNVIGRKASPVAAGL